MIISILVWRQQLFFNPLDRWSSSSGFNINITTKSSGQLKAGLTVMTKILFETADGGCGWYLVNLFGEITVEGVEDYVSTAPLNWKSIRIVKNLLLVVSFSAIGDDLQIMAKSNNKCKIAAILEFVNLLSICWRWLWLQLSYCSAFTKTTSFP